MNTREGWWSSRSAAKFEHLGGASELSSHGKKDKETARYLLAKTETISVVSSPQAQRMGSWNRD
jgi:hypothetical protein